MEFIIGLENDKRFGLIAKTYLIDKQKNKGFYPIKFQINTINFQKTQQLLNEQQIKIYRLTQEYNDDNIYTIFKSGKTKNKNKFFSALTNNDIENRIRPFIEKYLSDIIHIARKANVDVYKKNTHGYIDKDDRIELFNENAEALFSISKNDDGTNYGLSVRQNNQDISLYKKPYSVITNNPCSIIIQNKLHVFSNINFKKLLPFFDKHLISIPAKLEKKWFETFAFPTIKNHPVIASGFEIEEIRPSIKPVLELTEDIANQTVLALKFQYDNNVFDAGKGDKYHVDMEIFGDTFHFTKFKRNTDLENDMSDYLHTLGLTKNKFSFFIPGTEKPALPDTENSLHTVLAWLKDNNTKLLKKGFAIKQNHFERNYCFPLCKIIAKTEDYNDWFDIKAKVQIGDYMFPFVKLKRYILNDIRELQLPDGSYFLLPAEWFVKYKDIFRFGEAGNDKLRIQKHHFTLLQDEKETIGEKYGEKLKKLSKEINMHKIQVPETLDSVLRDYQKEGFNWMYMLHKHNFGGCLADDMGLGKTVQTLALILKIKNETDTIEVKKPDFSKGHQLNLFNNPDISDQGHETMQVKPVFLIVLPISLVHNWHNEIQKFTPQLDIYKHVGLSRTTQMTEFYNYDVILTTYGVVRNDCEELRKIEFYYIILDESQYIKNPSSKVYKSVIKLKSHNKLVLTGTPIENSLSDLWAQVNFLNRGLLGNYHFFRNEFIQPIEKYKDESKENKLQTIIQPFLIRRTKHQVAKELPQKSEQILYCDMTGEQADYYEREKSCMRNFILEKMENNSKTTNMHVLEGLSKLRQIANHPAMIDDTYDNESGKFNEICNCIDNLILEGHKVLIFSSYKKHLKLVQQYLEENGLRFSLLTGETRNREKEIYDFQNDEDNRVFLLQIKAGGFGLNLTAADYVMILDPWWNPAVEEQAINRAHRIGQDKNVMIYRFISVNTVEAKIQALKSRKASLAQSIIKPNTILNKLSKEQIIEFFS
ncbi:MAG: DEAD/DEAH box helicase [Bacteroidota bacterium]|nr:DEAD/DEAH box helicase [Bacteroidota bacterium]